MARRAKSNPSFLLPLEIEQVEPGVYLAKCKSLPGLLVQGDSVDEVVRIAPQVAQALVAAMRAKGVALPKALRVPLSPKRINLLVAA